MSVENVEILNIRTKTAKVVKDEILYFDIQWFSTFIETTLI